MLREIEIDVAADQQIGAIGEVEDTPDAEDQREADRNQRIEPAQKKALNQHLHHGICGLVAAFGMARAGFRSIQPAQVVVLLLHPARDFELGVGIFRRIDHTDRAVFLPLHDHHRRLGIIIRCGVRSKRALCG